jgi:hypothetical protein
MDIQDLSLVEFHTRGEFLYVGGLQRDSTDDCIRDIQVFKQEMGIIE